MFRAALTSRSCAIPHLGQSHRRSSKPSLPFLCPHPLPAFQGHILHLDYLSRGRDAVRHLVQEVLADVCQPAVSPAQVPPGPGPVVAVLLAASQLTMGPPESPEAGLERFQSPDLLNCSIRVCNGGEGL